MDSKQCVKDAPVPGYVRYLGTPFWQWVEDLVVPPSPNNLYPHRQTCCRTKLGRTGTHNLSMPENYTDGVCAQRGPKPNSTYVPMKGSRQPPKEVVAHPRASAILYSGTLLYQRAFSCPLGVYRPCLPPCNPSCRVPRGSRPRSVRFVGLRGFTALRRMGRRVASQRMQSNRVAYTS